MSDGGASDGEIAVAWESLLRQLVGFARSLRRRGADVSADATLTAAQALSVVGLGDRDRVRTALRAALINRREDLALFDALFPTFWEQVTDGAADDDHDTPDDQLLLPEPGAPPETEPEPRDDDGDDAGIPLESRRQPVDDAVELEDGEQDQQAVYSPTGSPELVEAGRDWTTTDDALARPVRELTDALAGLRGRRWVGGGDARPDVRRALRQSVETGGTILDLPGRERRESGVRAVLLVDVSRSVLDTVDRGFLLSFIRTVSQAWREVAVFFFDTSVREVTDAFDAPSPEAALSALEAAEAAWGGGTRIGHAIETVRRDHPLVVDRDTVVIVISDGLEVGEIDVLEREIAWLSARASAVLWANPLATSSEYEPTCRGMAVAMPFIDGLFAFATPDDVVEMARQLARHGPGSRVGYEFDRNRLE